MSKIRLLAHFKECVTLCSRVEIQSKFTSIIVKEISIKSPLKVLQHRTRNIEVRRYLESLFLKIDI